MRINYLLAAWTGSRRSTDTVGSYFLDYHLETLQRYAHSLAQVTVILPACKNNTPELKTRIGSQAVLLERENVGLSYGSWSYAYEVFPDFDYYILIEDDYVFCVDHFDRILVDLLEEKKCGYLCSQFENEKPWFGKNRGWRPHAGVANGIVSGKALAAVKRMHGRLPYIENVGYQCQSQIDFSAAVIDAGFSIADFRKHYRCPYFSELTRSLIDFAPERDKYLIMPVQAHLGT